MIADDAGDERDLGAGGNQPQHLLAGEMTGGDVVGADVGGDREAGGLGLLGVDLAVDIDDRDVLLRHRHQRLHQIAESLIGLTM